MSSGQYGEILLGRQGPPLDLLLPGVCSGFSPSCANRHQQPGRPGPTGTQGHGDSACQAQTGHGGSGPAVPAQGGLGLSQEVQAAHAGSSSASRAPQPPSRALPQTQHHPSDLPPGCRVPAGAPGASWTPTLPPRHVSSPTPSSPHCAMLGVVAQKKDQDGGEGAARTPRGCGAGCHFACLRSPCSADRHPGRPGAVVAISHKTGTHMPIF